MTGSIVNVTVGPPDPANGPGGAPVDAFFLMLPPLACSLRELHLLNNSLTGAVSQHVTSFSELRFLSLGYNNLTGT